MNKNQKENTKKIKRTSSSEKLQQQNSKITADNILAVLDLDTEIPEGLVDKVMKQKESVTISRSSGIDFSKYLQIAAVFAAAVFVGILLGRNADSSSFNKKQDREDRALNEFREKHHLSENYSFGRL